MNGGDNDMDGDGYINRDWLIDPTGVFYVERIAIVVSNDPYLNRYANGDPVSEDDTNNGGDNDIDGDGITDDVDDDMDNDGMDYVYEVKYGVANSGWQNPFIYNARYAILVGGGDQACENDLLEMYDKLIGYNYLEKNIYCLLWDKPAGCCGGRVDGAATKENMVDAFSQIRNNITRNDFFYFSEISHGNAYAAKDVNGVFGLSDGVCYFGPYTYNNKSAFNLSGLLNTHIKYYARSLFVMSSCGCAYAINQLHGENRIVITASSRDDWENALSDGEGEKITDVWHKTGDENHYAFIYQGNDKDWITGDHPKDGFVLSLGSSSNPNNVLHAFNMGYVAASNNRYSHPTSPKDYTSHPMLEDYSGNGTTGTQGKLSPSSAFDEGWLAGYTYL